MIPRQLALQNILGQLGPHEETRSTHTHQDKSICYLKKEKKTKTKTVLPTVLILIISVVMGPLGAKKDCE